MRVRYPIRYGLFERHARFTVLLFSEIIFGIIASVLSFGFFYWLTEGVLFHETRLFDQRVAQFVQSFRTPWLTQMMYFFTFLGSYALIVGAVLVVGLLWWKNKRMEAFYFLFILAMGLVLNLSVKQLIARPRPPHPMYHEIFYSFPSGHAMGSFVFYALLVFGIFHFTRKKRLSIILGTVMLVLVGLIGISRIYLGVHYPSDVIGGVIAGFWWVVVVLLIEKIYILVHFSKTVTKDRL